MPHGIIVLKAPDHVHDFVGVPGAKPRGLATTMAPLFFTRWIENGVSPFVRKYRREFLPNTG